MSKKEFYLCPIFWFGFAITLNNTSRCFLGVVTRIGVFFSNTIFIYLIGQKIYIYDIYNVFGKIIVRSGY